MVRPAVCPIPETHAPRAPDPAQPTPQFGTNCSDPSSPCNVEPTATCSVTAAGESATADEIWNIVGAAFPPGTGVDDLEFTYAYDPNLGFLGGPYTPQVTVELTGARFRFLTPLGRFSQLAAMQAGIDYARGELIVTMPGEDLNLGTGG